ncbi:MAG: hypothetical protein GF315_14135 [candidate division Zixibacteria bacterium]|nr:hypothetical protein [candidate division Zixibacteria bacterium]
MDIFAEITDSRAKSRQFVIAIIVNNSGHTPRDVGAKMLVYSDGSQSGTIGGGSFEKHVIDDCLKMMNDSIHHLLKTYRFEQSGEDSVDMMCGGESQVYMELNIIPDSLLIFGGGHVCNALVKIATDLDFAITVIDNRPNILDNYQPPVKTVYAGDNYSENLPAITQNSYIVIVTQGHRYDRDILAKVIKSECAYIGMIGSRKKIERTYSALEKEGINRELLNKVHAPIGLDIGAEGPHEIAVSIAAELIKVQRNLSNS